jgi:hypothetical protein
MAGFRFGLETKGGVPAEPPKLESIVHNWKPGDSIYLGRRTLRVLGFATTMQTSPRCSWLRTSKASTP